jgi:hypothetical protein
MNTTPDNASFELAHLERLVQASSILDPSERSLLLAFARSRDNAIRGKAQELLQKAA